MTEAGQKDVVSLEDRVRAFVEEVLTGTPHFVVEVEVKGARGSQVANVYVDSDGPLGLDDLARISRDLEFLLDTEDVFADRYRLNVSTPGVDRPLKLRRQYQKNVGRNVRVHYRKLEGEGNTETVGELTDAEGDSITLEPEGKEPVTIPYENILWTKVLLPW